MGFNKFLSIFLILFFSFSFQMVGSLNAGDNLKTQTIDLLKSDEVTRVILDSNQMIKHYWEITEFRVKFEAGEIGSEQLAFVNDYLKSLDSYNDLVKKVGQRMIRKFSLEEKTFISFSGYYRSLPSYLKEALDPVVKVLHENYIMTGKTQLQGTEFLAEYFPGYGYGDPNYKYRKGKELEREFLYARWLEESRVIASSKVVELVVEVSLVAGLKQANPDLQQIGSPFPIEIGGKIVIAVKVTWTNSTQITTRTKKKIGHHKVWFELYKAKKSWSAPVWELTGKTYELLEEATGEEVTVSIAYN